MNRRTSRPTFQQELTAEQTTEHLRQLCIFRHYLTELSRKLYPQRTEDQHLRQLVRAIDRHQMKYTGNPGHFHEGHVALNGPAND